MQIIKNAHPAEIILTQCYALIDRLGLSKCQVFRRKPSDDQVFLVKSFSKIFNSKGQLISECLFILFKLSKKPTKDLTKISALESKKWSNHKILGILDTYDDFM